MESLSVPRVPFDRVAARLDHFWDPSVRNVTQVLVGPTGSGKSHLIRYGLLPVRPNERVVILDSKGGNGDHIWHGWQATSELQRGFGKDREGSGPNGLHFRFVVEPSSAKQQVRAFLRQILTEGHCVVIIDEARSVSDGEQIGARSDLERLILEGRSAGVSVILGSQDIAYLPPAVRSQPATLWLGRQRNLKMARVLADLSGYGRELIEAIATIPPRSWLYTDSHESDPILALTGI